MVLQYPCPWITSQICPLNVSGSCVLAERWSNKSFMVTPSIVWMETWICPEASATWITNVIPGWLLLSRWSLQALIWLKSLERKTMSFSWLPVMAFGTESATRSGGEIRCALMDVWFLKGQSIGKTSRVQTLMSTINFIRLEWWVDDGCKILLMVQNSGDHLGSVKPPLNNGINYQPQLVNAGFLNHQTVWHSQFPYLCFRKPPLIYARMQWIWSLNVWPLEVVDYLQSPRSFWTGAMHKKAALAQSWIVIEKNSQILCFMMWNKLRCFWKMYIFPSRFWKGTFSSRLFYCDLLGSRGVFLKIYLRRVALAVTTWQRCWFFWKRTKRAQCRICHFPMMDKSWSRIYQRNATFGRIACCALAYQPEDRVCKQCLLQSWQVFVSDRFEQMCKVASKRCKKKRVERWVERWVFKYLES